MDSSRELQTNVNLPVNLFTLPVMDSILPTHFSFYTNENWWPGISIQGHFYFLKLLPFPWAKKRAAFQQLWN
jgi:hypothetical protein